VSDEQPLDYAAAESTSTVGLGEAAHPRGRRVDVHRGRPRRIRRLRRHVPHPRRLQRPVLVSSADGVGTKLRVAIEAGRHHTIGNDLVNHCVNDILVQGAVPLFFLDYFAAGRLEPAVVEAVVTGVAAGCRENGCSLVGGETAEMPGIYTPPITTSRASSSVVWKRTQFSARPRRGGRRHPRLASSGLHTNGYSLARRIVAERMRLRVDDEFPWRIRQRGRRAAPHPPLVSCRCSDRCWERSMAWPTSPAADCRAT
jgi:phosphoribosylaminoimidazole synthetase